MQNHPLPSLYTVLCDTEGCLSENRVEVGKIDSLLQAPTEGYNEVDFLSKALTLQIDHDCCITHFAHLEVAS